MQLGTLGVGPEHFTHVADAARRQRFDGSGGDGVDANVSTAKRRSQVAHGALQARLGT